MTDRAQFEAMLEALINDDQQSAKEIFHNIVVGKSREIYEELLAEDFNQDSGNPYSKQSESMEEDGEEMEEDGEEMEEEGAEEDDAEDDGEDDAEDDGEDEPEDDGEEDSFASDEEGDDDIEDRVMDLEDALEDLKAEFEQLLAGEEAEEHDHPGIHDMGGDDAMGGMDDMGMDEEEGMPMMEYVNKVPAPKHGDNGTNTKSTIDNMKNDMGGSVKNIAQSFSTEKGGTAGGLAKPTAGDLTAGLNVHNRPGSDAGKSAFKKQQPGHGPEKKGHAEGGAVGSVASNKEGGRNTKSLISKRVR
jgi:hypothetical protein